MRTEHVHRLIDIPGDLLAKGGAPVLTAWNAGEELPGLAEIITRILLVYGLSSLPVFGVWWVWLSMMIGTGVQFAVTCALFRQRS